MTLRATLIAITVWLTPYATAADRPAAVKERAEKYPSGDQELTARVFSPDKPGKAPVVVLIHGADGLQFERWVQVYGRMARAIAGHGYLVVMPHYFEKTGSNFGDLGTILKNYPAWFGAVKDAVTYAGKLPRADPDRLALVGVSLGGTLAVDTAAKDKRVKVLVDVFGGVPDLVAGQVKTMPPTLILHGDKDRLVPLKDSERLDALLTRLKVEHEFKVYPGAGHGFTGDDEKDFLDRTGKFLDKHLPPAK